MPDKNFGNLLGFHPILSADSRFTQTDFANDQSWEICEDLQAPLHLLAETSFGLRAKMAQVFPVLLDANNLPFRDPYPKLQLEKILPDLVMYRVGLFSDMDVELILNVPNSQTLSGLFTIKMTGTKEKRIRVGVMVRLLPIQNGQIMSIQQMDERTILTGRTEDLYPVCVVAGIPIDVHRPQPGLVVDIVAIPDHPVHIRWAISSTKSKAMSLESAIRFSQGIQVPSIQRSIRENEIGGLQIHTGNPDWNEAFHLARVQSHRLFFSQNDILPFPTAVNHRQPDTGNSLRGDGSDYLPDLQGLSVWECYYAIHNLYLPEHPRLAAGLFSNFIQLQQGYGNVDYQPGLGGYKSHILAPPILANLLLEIHQSYQNINLIRESYPILVYLVERWIDLDHDRDGDHLPEWDHIQQTGWEGNPLFDRWATKNRPIPIDSVESPQFGAIIFRELLSLEALAGVLDKPDDALRFRELAELTNEQVKSMWDRRRKIFRYRDRDTHSVPSGELLFSEKGNGIFYPAKTFSPSQRLVVEIHIQPPATSAYDFRLVGMDEHGLHIVEKLEDKQAASGVHRYVITSRHHFAQLTQVSISGLAEDARWSIHSMDLGQIDLTNFLPLWAGIPNKADADALMTRRFIPDWFSPTQAGLPMIVDSNSSGKTNQTNLSNPLFHSLILDGLLRYGYQNEAGVLVNGLMEAIIKNVRTSGAFSQSMDVVSGIPYGANNSMYGLPPIGLFLRSLGLEIYAPDRMNVWGTNPYPWDTEISFRGTRIFRSEKDVEITFPDGQTIHLQGPERQQVSRRTDQGGL